MKYIILILMAINLVACGTEEISDKIKVAALGEDKDCAVATEINPAIDKYRAQLVNSIKQVDHNNEFDWNRFNTELSKIKVVQFANPNDPMFGGKYGVNRVTECYGDKTIYRIYIMDISQLPKSHPMRNPVYYKALVFHEYLHVIYDNHAHDDDNSLFSEDGIMAGALDVYGMTEMQLLWGLAKIFESTTGG